MLLGNVQDQGSPHLGYDVYTQMTWSLSVDTQNACGNMVIITSKT